VVQRITGPTKKQEEDFGFEWWELASLGRKGEQKGGHLPAAFIIDDGISCFSFFSQLNFVSFLFFLGDQSSTSMQLLRSVFVVFGVVMRCW
jgi:hypothetical protein